VPLLLKVIFYSNVFSGLMAKAYSALVDTFV